MPHDHYHYERHIHVPNGEGRLIGAMGLNLLLTLIEVLAGVISGSLALVADGVHNFQDCASLAIALVARRVARRPSDHRRTFGYRRAEIIGALVNLIVLSVIGVFLVYEALHRFFEPRPINGWLVIGVAAAAVVINVATALLLFAVSHVNMNFRAAFLHNLGDALSSCGVILAGVALLMFGAIWVDAAVTIAIAAYILWQSFPMIARSIHILLEGVPADVVLPELIADLYTIDGVADVHHVHVWEMDEEHRALEAHVVVMNGRLESWSRIKAAIKARLRERYSIHHSTLEFETIDEAACEACPPSQPAH
jgi:cobalt-zinc-cadmium efflux system protein